MDTITVRNVQQTVKCARLAISLIILRVCRITKKKNSFGQLSSDEESDSSESFGQIVVGKLETNRIASMVTIEGTRHPCRSTPIKLAADTGISKTLLNRTDWYKIAGDCKFVKTSKRFRPYGITYHKQFEFLQSCKIDITCHHICHCQG